MQDKETPLTLTCLICGKTLTAEICIDSRITKTDTLPEEYDDTDFLPLEAIEMTSYGHYGTTFFDPCDDGTQVAALICDNCMESRSERLLYIDKQRRLKPFDATMKELDEKARADRAAYEATTTCLPPQEIPRDEDGYPDVEYVDRIVRCLIDPSDDESRSQSE